MEREEVDALIAKSERHLKSKNRAHPLGSWVGTLASVPVYEFFGLLRGGDMGLWFRVPQQFYEPVLQARFAPNETGQSPSDLESSG